MRFLIDVVLVYGQHIQRRYMQCQQQGGEGDDQAWFGGTIFSRVIFR